jgi:hypothetical protein
MTKKPTVRRILAMMVRKMSMGFLLSFKFLGDPLIHTGPL